jgi:hypothetical protein
MTGRVSADPRHLAHDKTHWWTFLNTVMNFSPMKGRECHEQLRGYKLYKDDTAPWSCLSTSLRSTLKRTFRPEQTN